MFFGPEVEAPDVLFRTESTSLPNRMGIAVFEAPPRAISMAAITRVHRCLAGINPQRSLLLRSIDRISLPAALFERCIPAFLSCSITAERGTNG
jgi:hypothetical protein